MVVHTQKEQKKQVLRKVKMGLATKIIVLAAIVIGLIWAFSSLKITTINVCVGQEPTLTAVTCVEDVDCVNYLTSQYGTYPDSKMYKFILGETSNCAVGKCEVRDFQFADTCAPGSTPLKYKVTAKEWVDIQ